MKGSAPCLISIAHLALPLVPYQNSALSLVRLSFCTDEACQYVSIPAADETHPHVTFGAQDLA